MRKLIPFLLVLLLVIPAIAVEFDDHVNVIKKYYKEKETDEEALRTWKHGMMEVFDFTLDHITIRFDFVQGDFTTDGKVAIVGVVTTTGFCLSKDNNKVRVIQMVGVVVLMTKDIIIEKVFRITDFEHEIVPGWESGVKV